MNIEQEREKLHKLVDEVNQALSNEKINLGKEQEGKGEKNISIRGGDNGTLWITVATNYDIGLSGISIEDPQGEMYKFMCDITHKVKHDKYGYKSEEKQPKWETKDFEIVRKVVYKYAGVKKENIEQKFMWVKWFGELATVISNKNQETMSVKINQIIEDKNQSIIRFEAYDPFSFFYYLAQKNTKHQKELFFKNTDKVFNIKASLPDFDNDNFWIFPTPTPQSNVLYKWDDKYEPDLLWDFFQQIMSIRNIDELATKATDAEFIDDFKGILNLTSVGVPKLTQTLFLINPNVFFTIDWILKPISNKLLDNPNSNVEINIKQLKRNIETEGFSAYLKIMQKICGLFPNKTPYEINDQLWENGGNMGDELQEKIDLLKHKKQIILQGSPGTGKTRLAKEIAYNLITGEQLSGDKNERKEQFELLIKTTRKTDAQYDSASDKYKKGLKLIKIEQKFFTIGQNTEFTISKIDGEKIYIKNNENGEDISVGKDRIISYINDKNYNETYGHYSYHQPIAKFINEEILKECNQIMLLKNEFLSASGEKFEITNVTSNKVSYKIENKSDNFYFHINDGKLVGNNNAPAINYFDAIKDRMDSNNFAQCKIIQFHPAYSYEDFVRGIVATTTDDGQVSYKVQNKVLAEMAENANKEYKLAKDEGRKPKKFVLIIDEINRANLSAVLGELIYALEYRGEAVESMYKLDGSQEIVLPENLYIIGTMNTADRSVGYIDYAIRRRFAFVNTDTNPKVIKKEKAINLFKKVEKLFDTYLNKEEFELNDVMIGHSYFLTKDIDLAWEYEIKPILQEYRKDGVLTCEKDKIDNLKTEQTEG